MTTDAPETVTLLLTDIKAGNEEAKEKLFECVYEELRKLAHAKLMKETPSHSWGSADLVHEAYFQLMKGQKVFTENRAYFFGAAARAMWQLLSKRAADHNRNHRNRVLIDVVLDRLETNCGRPVTDLDVALERFSRIDPRAHEVVMLRFFGGLQWQEIADHLNISVSLAEKDWQYARAWLKGQLKGVAP